MPRRLPHRPPEHSSVRTLARDQGGVLSRKQLYAIKVPRWEIAAHVRAGRWRLIGDQAVCLHNGPIAPVGQWWAAIFLGGPRACLDGAAALVAGGLQRFDVDTIRVSVPRGARIRRLRPYDIRQTRRWSVEDLAASGIPRTRPDVAAVRAAIWARSNRQATYVLTLVVQQGLATPEQLGAQALRIRRDKRRALIHETVLDLLGGVRSLGEIDVVRELRRRGLPAPEKQVLRRSKQGRYYLDFSWPAYRLVLEVDGIHHTWVDQIIGDALRQNSLAIEGDTVLRLPLLGLRLEPDAFFAQIEEALTKAGFNRAA
jgi:very-short-patch-repair endonuclease